MSNYVRQYADRPGEWFQENPPDAREGDECFCKSSGKWQACRMHLPEWGCYNERRRLISPGAGWRIVDETAVNSWLAAGVNAPKLWEGTSDGIHWSRKVVDAIAIRQPIPVSTGKNLGDARLTASIDTGSGPVPVERIRGATLQIDIALDEIKSAQRDLTVTQRRIEWLKEQPSDPRIQAVIDAARVYLTWTTKNKEGWRQREALESALAALGEPAELKPFTTWCEKNAALGTEPTKDDEWPRYWWWGSDDFGSLHREDADGSHHYWIQNEFVKQTQGEDKFSYAKHAPCKRLTPAEAQARMEGKEATQSAQSGNCAHCDKPVKECECFSEQRPTVNPPAQDELQVLLERVKEIRKEYEECIKVYSYGTLDRSRSMGHSDQCLEIQRWIEDAMKGRPQKVEVDVIREWFQQTIGVTGDQIEAVKDFIKYQAAKAKGGGE